MAASVSLRHSIFRQGGVSLLEVLAAMVILSAGATVAFTWFNQSAIVLGQVKSDEAQLLARNEALDYLQHVNPDVSPQGVTPMQGFELRWSSKPVLPQLSTVTELGTTGGFNVTLHEVNVVLVKSTPGRGGASIESEGQEWVSFKLHLAGHTRRQSAAGSVFGGGPAR